MKVLKEKEVISQMQKILKLELRPRHSTRASLNWDEAIRKEIKSFLVKYYKTTSLETKEI